MMGQRRNVVFWERPTICWFFGRKGYYHAGHEYRGRSGSEEGSPLSELHVVTHRWLNDQYVLARTDNGASGKIRP